MRVLGTCLTSLLTLTACFGGGGGGGSGGGAAPGFAGLNLPLAVDPATFETDEYRRSGGLQPIGASTLYAAGGAGAGVTVGIIDTGIDAANPEFAGALHPASTDLLRGGPLTDGSGHGTAVAGLVGARRNDQATHGVAYDSRLLMVRADTPGSCPDACLFSQGNLASATDYAVAQGARVLNLSLGDAGGLAGELRQSLSAAASADRVLVFAAGNTGSASPRQPGLFAATPEARGRGIVVGAVDRDQVIADFSNRAGSAADVFLVAPGEGLRTVADGGGNAIVSGTSAAAPIVAGAAANLLSAAPHLSGASVVSILLDSARDLGAPGTDAVYGRGMLDLARALQPMGPLRVPEGVSTSDAARPLAGSQLAFGPAFGVVAPATGPVMALDVYDRAYDVAGAIVATTPERAALPDLLARQLSAAMEHRVAGALALEVNRARLPSTRGLLEGSDIVGLAADWRVSDLLALRAAAGDLGSASFAAGGAAMGGLRSSGHAGFWAFAAETRLGVDATVADDWRLSLDLAADPGLAGTLQEASIAAPDGDAALPGGRLAALAIERRSRRGGAWRIGLGRLAEAEGPLGSRAGGAMRAGAAITDFIELAAEAPLGARLGIFARAQLGRTDLGGGTGLIGDVEPFWSSAFELGIGAGELLLATDRVGFSVRQPLRVETGSLTLDLPVARDLAGNVQRRRRAVGLAPGGRELDLELSYGVDLGGGRLQSALMLRLEPNHDASAEPEMLLGLSYRLGF